MNMVRIGGHFGELLQGTVGGEVALLTLPCPALAVTARVIGPGQGLDGPLPEGVAQALLDRLGLPWPGRVAVSCTMPVGAGAGSSTASLIALARLAGWRGPPLALARACVAAEGASDPLMLRRPGRVLWASRRARVLARLAPLRPCVIAGAFFGPPVPTRAASDFAAIDDLIPQWRRAPGLSAQAALASESAARRVGGGEIAALARDMGALGWVAAHTGSARGLIFAPGTLPTDWAAALAEAGGAAPLAFAAGE